MTTQEELEIAVRKSAGLEERLRKCQFMIGSMCDQGRPPKMSVPLQWRDEDFFIVSTISDAIKFIKQTKENHNV